MGCHFLSYSFSSSHIWMWQLVQKEDWAPKNWWLWTVVLEKMLENPLNCKEIKSVNPKGNQSWIFTGRTDAEAEAPVLWPPDVKSWLTRKDSHAGKDRRQKEKGQQRMNWLIASLTQRTCVWANSRRQWRTGKPGMLQSMGSQRIRHDLVTEHQQQTLPFLEILIHKSNC